MVSHSVQLLVVEQVNSGSPSTHLYQKFVLILGCTKRSVHPSLVNSLPCQQELRTDLAIVHRCPADGVRKDSRPLYSAFWPKHNLHRNFFTVQVICSNIFPTVGHLS